MSYLVDSAGKRYIWGGKSATYPKTAIQILNDGRTKGWYIADASYITLVGDVSISQWNDISGKNNHMINNTVTERPQWDAANLEVDFNVEGAAGADNLQKSSVVTPQPFTMYCVVRQNTYSTGSIMMNFYAGGAYIRQRHLVPGQLDIYCGVFLTCPSAGGVGSYGIISAIADGSNSVIQWNEAAIGIGNCGERPSDYIRIGAGTAVGSDMSIKEYIFRSGADSSENRIAVVRYLNNKYSIY